MHCHVTPCPFHTTPRKRGHQGCNVLKVSNVLRGTSPLSAFRLAGLVEYGPNCPPERRGTASSMIFAQKWNTSATDQQNWNSKKASKSFLESNCKDTRSSPQKLLSFRYQKPNEMANRKIWFKTVESYVIWFGFLITFSVGNFWCPYEKNAMYWSFLLVN